MTATEATRVIAVPAGPYDARLAIARAGFLAGYKPGTRASYAESLRQWCTWCADHGLDPLDVERAHIELWARSLEEQRHLAPATVLGRLCTLRSFYRYCEDEDLIAGRSPAARVHLPKVSPDSTTVGMSRAEISRLLAASAYDDTYHALICLLVLNGLRISEACGADIDDLGVASGHRTLIVTRKGAKRQRIPLSAKTARALDAAIGQRSSGPILLTHAATRMTRQNAAKVLERLGRRAGLPMHVHCHMLRHGFITVALDAGVPLHDVQDSAGHADPRTTMRYNRNRFSLDRNATHIVTAFVAGG